MYFGSVACLAILSHYLCHLADAYIDPYIICTGSNPAPNDNWPNGFSPDLYDDNNINLCSGAYGLTDDLGRSLNLGCKCTQELGQMLCGILPANRRLVTANLMGGNSFPAHCVAHCTCSTADKVHEYAKAGARYQGRIVSGDFGGDSLQPYTPSNVPYGTDRSEVQPPGDPVQAGNVCGAPNCTSMVDCHGFTECDQCVTVTTVFPGGPVVSTLSICGISGGGKRDLDPPCVCNSSYISYGCCDAHEGLVWEAPDFKLGELAVEDSDLR